MFRTISAALAGALAAQLFASVAVAPERGADAELLHELRGLLSHVELVRLDDGQGNLRETLRFEGVNVQIVNGLGDTASTNGLGNLLIGYAEPGDALDRTGSHNLALGSLNDYASTGGIVSGTGNSLRGPDASVLSSGGCEADGPGPNVVLAGNACRVDGLYSAVIAGDNSAVTGSFFSTLTGAWFSDVEYSEYSHVLGGQGHRITSSNEATITGGEGHTIDAAGITSFVGGTRNNALVTTGGVALGGSENTLGGGTGQPLYPALLGGRANRALADFAAVLGGRENTASGVHAVVGGGRGRSATGTDDWVAGGLFQDE